MRLFYRPVKPFSVTQYFGENKACVDLNTGTKTIYCDGLNPPAGYKSVYSMMKGHNGLDLSAKRWQPVYAAREGVVNEVSTEEARGLGIGLFHDFGVNGCWRTRYWHLAALEVHIGDKVSTGQLIGYADNTGYSSGDHLHFEVKRVSPDDMDIYNYDNGYFGAVDPCPLLFSDYAVDVNLLRKSIELASSMLQKIIDSMRALRT